MQLTITNPQDAYHARLDLVRLRAEQRDAKRTMALAEARCVLAVDGKNAEQRAAQIALALATDPYHGEALEWHETATGLIGAIEAGLLRYAEERDDARADLRERELAQRLAEVGP
jgi:hypothetical protein